MKKTKRGPFMKHCVFSIENLFIISFSMSFTEINHFSISSSFCYWNITGAKLIHFTSKTVEQSNIRAQVENKCVILGSFLSLH